MNVVKLQKTLLWAFKIGIGCSMAICIAEVLHLEHTASAGSIALLTLVSTKWGTVKLSLYRLITFVISVILALFCFELIPSQWMALGIYVFLIVVICELLKWRSTISVNVLIGLHFLSFHDYSMAFIYNEFMLVLIGITLAFILNLFHDYKGQRTTIESYMRYSEQKLQLILKEAAGYLLNDKQANRVWSDIGDLEKKLDEFKQEAHEYQDNTFVSHPEYYISYFDMRLEQCIILNNLHDNLKKLRSIPKQAEIIADYMIYLTDYVIEIHVPDKQLERLHQIFADMRTQELPTTREEFENRAHLYHILMDLEDFLMAKTRFVEGMDHVQKKKYWEK